MKNNKSLIALFVALIVCLTCLFTACNNNAQDARDPQIVAIYDSYVANATEKGETPLSYEEWLNSIKGAKGDTGATGAKGDTGAQGEQGIQGEKGDKGDKGDNGVDGKSAYELWKAANPESTLTLEQWLESLKGANGQNGTNGTDGTNGTNGVDGVDGKSAYELWKEANPDSNLTQAEWLESLVGSQGPKGDKGDKGDTGATGAQGEQGIQGSKGDKGDKGETGATGAQGEQGIQGEKGDKGDKGDNGETGATGATGRIGFIVSTADQFKAAVTVDNAYVLLASDITLTDKEKIVITKNVVVDLGGHTVTGGEVLFADGKESYATLTNGKIVSSSYPLTAQNGATLVVEEGLTVEADEACLFAWDAGKLIINGGTYTSKDNFVIGTHGSAGRGNNIIEVNGGTFNGNIRSAGSIACGIYVANNDEVTVNGGTFNITNGVGIVARSGKTTVNEGVQINLTAGDRTEGRVGDKKLNLPTGKELVLDIASGYPGGVPTLENNSNYSVYTLVAASTEEELTALLADTSVNNIVIANDIVATNELRVENGRVCTVDLNGHSVKLEYAENVSPINGSVFYIIGKGTHLTINDSSEDQTGKVIGSDKTFASKVTSAVRVGKWANLTINGGHFYGMSEGTSCIYVFSSTISSHKATVVINGGTFETASPANGKYYVLNHEDKATTGCTITVNGGTFKNYNPGVTAVDPVNAKTGKIVLGEGCKTTETTDGTDTWYTVSK